MQALRVQVPSEKVAVDPKNMGPRNVVRSHTHERTQENASAKDTQDERPKKISHHVYPFLISSFSLYRLVGFGAGAEMARPRPANCGPGTKQHQTDDSPPVDRSTSTTRPTHDNTCTVHRCLGKRE